MVNAGSTSVKLRVVDGNDSVVRSADLDRPGPLTGRDVSAFLESAGPIDAIGHRVVHGGPDFDGPAIVDDELRSRLEGVSELAPLHNPPALGVMDLVRGAAPDTPNVACFDTSFHSTIPEAARRYALPSQWVEHWGIRRYGFHGLSCEWAAGRVAAMLGYDRAPARSVVCHLGGGASVSAVCGGRSVDTTMGFTPVEGLVMATRSGDVDPGAIAWLAGKGIDAAELAEGLETRSGLFALSGGRSGDMRVLLRDRGAGDSMAGLAVDVYLHRLRAKIAAMVAAMGGLDCLVFTGGVGENAAMIRCEACQGMAFMGIVLDRQANEQVDGRDAVISHDDSRTTVVVIHSREELVVARQCRRVLGRRDTADPAPNI